MFETTLAMAEAPSSRKGGAPSASPVTRKGGRVPGAVPMGPAPVTRLRVIVRGIHVFLSAGWRRAARNGRVVALRFRPTDAKDRFLTLDIAPRRKGQAGAARNSRGGAERAASPCIRIT